MNHSQLRAVVVLSVLLLLGGSVLAAPFEIRRSDGDAASVRAATVVATTSFAPFNDASGTLSDGSTTWTGCPPATRR